MVFFIVVVFFAGSLAYVNSVIFNPDTVETVSYGNQDAVTATIKDDLADSDGDGLVNYLEVLYGTSKKHTDSDGDGVSDGDEVAQGTDPTIYGQYQQPKAQVITEDTVVYEFEQTANPQSIEEIMDLVGSVEITTEEEVPLTQEQIVLKQCFNNLASHLQNSLVTSINDAASINSFLTNETTNTYPIEQIQNAAFNAVQALGVPTNEACRDLENARLTLVEVYSNQAQSLEQVLNTTASTTEHYEAWTNYAQSVQNWTDSVIGLRDIALRKGVTFSPSEPGFMFTQGI